MTSEAQGEEEKAAGSLAEFVGNLLGKLKAKKSANDEVSVMNMRQQVLAGELPPVIQFSAGDVIFRAGEQSDCLYDIHDGVVGIYSDYQTPNEKLLAELSTDEVFGEMGILDDMPRSASAVCLKDCTVLVVKPENFMMFFQKKPAMVLQILQRMCIQVRDLGQRYLKACKAMEEMSSADVLKELEQICNN